MRTTITRKLAGTLAVITAASLLAACDKPGDTRSAGQKLDATVAKAEQKTSEMGSQVKEASKDVLAAAKNGVASAGDKVKDASITSAVNAKLAADASLSALRINVDTVDGHVVLSGSAPSAMARDHATVLASRVAGVTSVENHLVVANRS